MNILQLTPGTGSFHCGNCIRDHDLSLGLRAAGHRVLMVPMYLPFVLDQPDPVPAGPLFYGGINVYLRHKSPLFRKAPRWLTRVLDHAGLLRLASRRAGMTSPRELGEITLSMLRGEEGRQARELDALVAWIEAQQDREQFDLVVLSAGLLLGLARRLRRDLGLHVVCTLGGEESYLDSLPAPLSRQAWELTARRSADAEAFICPSEYSRQVMIRRLGLDPAAVHVVHNGIDPSGYAPAQARQPTIGYLARLHPDKGLDTLVEAFLRLKQRGRVPEARLRIAGAATSADEPFIRQQQQRLARAGVRDCEFLPNVNRQEKLGFLQSLSVFSVPARYGEAFGLYLLEAWASGLPVVQPRHAAFPELLELSGGGRLCEPNDPESLAQTLEGLLLDPAQARELGQRGRTAVAEHFTLERMAQAALRVYEAVVKAPAAAPAQSVKATASPTPQPPLAGAGHAL